MRASVMWTDMAQSSAGQGSVCDPRNIFADYDNAIHLDNGWYGSMNLSSLSLP